MRKPYNNIMIYVNEKCGALLSSVMECRWRVFRKIASQALTSDGNITNGLFNSAKCKQTDGVFCWLKKYYKINVRYHKLYRQVGIKIPI